MLDPQQYATPDVVTAQECAPPAETVDQDCCPLTVAAVERDVREESPNCPLEFEPQHERVPLIVTAQE